MTTISEQVVAEGRSMLRIIAALNSVHEHDILDQNRAYRHQVRKRIQAIVDRNQEISDKRRHDQK